MQYIYRTQTLQANLPISHSGKYLLSGGLGRVIRVWNFYLVKDGVLEQRALHELEGH